MPPLQPIFNGTTGSKQKNLCEEGVGKINKELFFVTKQGVSLVKGTVSLDVFQKF